MLQLDRLSQTNTELEIKLLDNLRQTCNWTLPQHNENGDNAGGRPQAMSAIPNLLLKGIAVLVVPGKTVNEELVLP